MARKLNPRIRSKFIATQVIALVLASLISLNIPISHSAKTVIPRPGSELKLKATAQIRTEAGWYDAAMKEISRISTMKLETENEVKAAIAIVERNAPNLRYNRSKLVTLGFDDAIFTSAIKATVKDDKSAKAMATAIAQDPTNILKINGGQSLADRMRRTLDADRAKLNQIAVNLKKAAEALKAKASGHHSFRTPTSRKMEVNLSSKTTPYVMLDDVAIVVVAVAVIVVPPLQTALIVAAATTLIGKLVENVGTDEGRDQLAACLEEAERNYRRCADGASNAGLFATAIILACQADWLLASAACLIS